MVAYALSFAAGATRLCPAKLAAKRALDITRDDS